MTVVALVFGSALFSATLLLAPVGDAVDGVIMVIPTLVFAIRAWAADRNWRVGSLSELERRIREHISESSKAFSGADDDQRIWIVKYLAPRWLEAFMKTGQLGVSSTPGFTWGDGVYVTPLKHAYSSMMYGRAGILGYLEQREMPRIYDAVDPRGIQFYQDWIYYLTNLYKQLTTTIHADVANRELRNLFRQHFDIDLVVFEPDERTQTYSSPDTRWYCVSDWDAMTSGIPKAPPLSTRVKHCRFIAVVGEEFAREQYQPDWPRFFASTLTAGLTPTWIDVAHPDDLAKHFMAAYAANASTLTPHAVNCLVQVRPAP